MRTGRKELPNEPPLQRPFAYSNTVKAIGTLSILMSDQSRTDSGHYVETITLERVFRVFDQIEGPTITSRDVADVLDCSTEAARQKLGQLHEQGRIHRRKSGRTVLWWRADDAQAATEFDPDDPLFAEPPSFASEEPTDAANVDEYLYGPIEADSDDE